MSASDSDDELGSRNSDDDAFFAECNDAAAALETEDIDAVHLDDELLLSAFPASSSSSPPAENDGAVTNPDGQSEERVAPAIALMRENVNKSCDEFVGTFLAHGGAIGELHHQLQLCDATLSEVEASLRRYLRRTDSVSRDIGELQQQSARTTMALRNTAHMQRLAEQAMSAMIVPPDSVRLILSAPDNELGTQFVLEIQRLGELILNRRRGYIVVDATASPPKVLDITKMAAYAQSGPVLRGVTAAACLKIRNFLMSKFDLILGRGRTNVAIQQQNVLRDYRPMMAFLRDAGAAFADPVGNPAAVFFEELRRRYCALLSAIYFSNVKQYILQCNALEADSATTAATPASSSSAFGFASVFGSSKQSAYRQPTLTDKSGSVVPEDFALGARGAILDNVRAMPVIPVVARRQKKHHTYEETFRSVQVLLTDAVTSEFLFSFDFFCGDSTVYVDVFKPTIQLVVDYVAEVVLRDSGTSTQQQQHQQFSSLHAASTNTDFCGLLILIRLVHLFKVSMHGRRLRCLDGYFDSLLLLLWPAFKVAFDRQLASMRTCMPATAMAFLSMHRSDLDRLKGVHPIASRYAHMSLALMALSRGIELPDVPDNVPVPPALRQLLAAGAASSMTESDAAESVHRFAVLESNLSYVRVEFERIIRRVADDLVAALARSTPGVPLSIAKHIYIVNNYFAVLSVWSAASRDGGGSDLTSPLAAMSPGSAIGSGGGGGESESGGSGFDERDAERWMQPDSVPLSTRLVHARSDYTVLHDAYVESCTQIAAEIVRQQCSAFVAFVDAARADVDSSAPQPAPAVVAKIGRDFAASVRDDALAIASTIRAYVVDPANALVVVKRAASELVVANSTFHRVASRALAGEGQATLRQVVVTTQQLLGCIRRIPGLDGP